VRISPVYTIELFWVQSGNFQILQCAFLFFQIVLQPYTFSFFRQRRGETGFSRGTQRRWACRAPHVPHQLDVGAGADADVASVVVDIVDTIADDLEPVVGFNF
jgi:hypothetical protein